VLAVDAGDLLKLGPRDRATARHPRLAHVAGGAPARLPDPPAVATPEELCRFVVSEWPDQVDPFAAWCQACIDYIHEHGHGTLLGDPLDVLAVQRDMKVRWASGDD
jgi:hypothetical protein